MTRILPRLFATLAGAPFALVPRPHRYRTACRVGVLVGRVLRLLRVPRLSLLDGYTEDGIRLTLHAIRRLGIPFDPQLRVDGPDVPKGPAIVVTAHFLMVSLLARWLMDRDVPPVLVAAYPQWQLKYPGSDVPMELLEPNPAILLQMRRKLAEGKKIVIMIEDAEPREGWLRVETSEGTRFVSDASFRFAEKAGVPVFFAAVHAGRDGMPEVRIEAAPRRAEDALEAYVAFLVRETAAVLRP